MPAVWAVLIPFASPGSDCPFLFPFSGTHKEADMKNVGIFMGSDIDLPVVLKALDTLDALGVPNEAHL